jgi:type II secretory pathway component PulM
VSALSRLVPRDRRALALGAAALVPALLFRGVLQPYLRARATVVEQLRAQRALLDRELSALAAARQLPRRRERVAGLLAADAPRLLSGGDPLAATAELVGYVGEAARRNHVQLQELQSRSAGAAPAPPGDDVIQVRVELRGQTDFEGILRLLQTLERGPRLVRVDALVIEQGVTASRQRETLTVRAAMSGYVALSGPSQARGPGL